MKHTVSRTSKVARILSVWVLLPVILFMNSCRLMTTERRQSVGDGFLVARAELINPGALTDYVGNVRILPRYTPPIWPVDALLSCEVLSYRSDPQIDIAWKHSELRVRHNQFHFPVSTRPACYGRSVTFERRSLLDA